MRYIFVAALAAVTLHCTAFAQEDKVDADDTVTEEHLSHGVPLSKSPSGALLRSLLVPGWGQSYTGHWIKAVVFLGTDAGLIYGAIVQHDKYKENLENIDLAKTPSAQERFGRLADFYRDDRNRLVWWTVGLTLIAGFDAYVEAHLYDFRIDPGLGTTPEADGPALNITITFP